MILKRGGEHAHHQHARAQRDDPLPPPALLSPPLDDGRPDLPWHSVDDLQACFGLNRQERRAFLQIWRRDAKRTGFLMETVATEDGLVTIAPHYAGQGACSALRERLGVDIEHAYCLAASDAAQKIAGHLHGGDLLQWMGAALHRHDEKA